MKRMTELRFGIILLMVILVISFCSAAYQRSNVAYTQQGTGFLGYNNQIEREYCREQGQDFILQMAPFGCTPSVVRSDLLEEQDVAVFCQISATKINPLIDIESIKDIDFTGIMPNEIRGMDVIPSQSALALNQEDLNSPVLNNVGYAVIVLKQIENESSMPDYVQGTVTARLKYDIKNAFGLGTANFYLPEIAEDNEWEQRYKQYSFWEGKGYLRAEDISEEGARIVLYNDQEILHSVDLSKGQTSGKIYLPGFDCLAGLTITLNDLEAPDTTARLSVNGGNVEVKKGEKFLENKCTISDIKKQGIVQRVEIKCNTDDKKNQKFSLSISPRIKLRICDGSDCKDGEYSVGEWLYDEDVAETNPKHVYLGFIGEIIQDEEKIQYAYLVGVPDKVNKLGSSELDAIALYDTMFASQSSTGTKIIDWGINAARQLSGALLNFGRWSIKGENFKFLSKGQEEEILSKKVSILGLGEGNDYEIGESAKEDYEKALNDFDYVINNFREEKYPESSTETLGEKSFAEKIKLAFNLQQKKNVIDLCEEFERQYPDSNYIFSLRDICNNEVVISSPDILSQSVLIDNEVREITFKGIYEPSFEEYGATVLVRNDSGYTVTMNFNKKGIYYFSSFFTGTVTSPENHDNIKEKFIQLIEINEDLEEAEFQFSSGLKTLKKDISQRAGDYTVTLIDARMKKVAKVTVKDEIDYTRSDSNFSFKIGIEKRGIKLSPDQIRDKIDALNDSISYLESISSRLGKVVKGMKTACLATDLALTIKNLYANAGGKSIARQEVMRSSGGWYDRCANLVRTNEAEYPTIEKCLVKHSSDIEDDVNTRYNGITTLNDEIKKLQQDNNLEVTGAFGQKVVDTQASAKLLLNTHREEIEDNLKGKFNNDYMIIGDDNISISKFADSLSEESVSIDKIKSLILNSRIEGSDTSKEMAYDILKEQVGSIYENTKIEVTRTTLASELGIPEVDYSSTGLREIGFSEDIIFAQVRDKLNYIPYNISGDSYVRIFVDGATAKKYLIVLDNERHVKETYLIEEGNRLVLQNEANPLRLEFKKYDSSSYKNLYQSSLGDTVPVLRYYETEPYKGYPAIVPFDEKEGWYVSIKQTLPIGSSIQSYDDSGRVNSFYLCNVGKNHKEEDKGGDDICRSFINGQYYDQFPGLKDTETRTLVQKAINAIAQAQKAYHSGVSSVSIDGFSRPIKVGSPAIDVPDIQCQDVMSPKDCQLLFNVCDPVICPSSRCDLGGKYPVANVIQSGVIGSIVLCYPNYKEGIYIPVCLSGIQSGLDGWISVQKSYQECLNKNLETGETVGICDEIHSIYGCEFFWREVAPIAQLAIPKIIEIAMGQGTRGGGEYLGVASAWANAEKSMTYFSQYYAANSYKAFQARSTEEVGGEFCKAFVSGVIPTNTNALDVLTEPDSPPQFTAWFEEIPFTTTTNPPLSQYKVYYHIYAGKDSGVYYKVYLKGSEGTSFYQDTTSNRLVDGASGYINRGETVDQTPDFTAPSGYPQLCVMINSQEECGFKQVSTDFSLNYITDKYVAEQASKEDIKTQSECVSGSSSAYALLNPNVQEGVSNAISPELYNQGITRVCATENPGKGTDASYLDPNKSRWKNVGYCDDTNIKCWLDVDSVKEVIENSGIEAKVLDEKNKQAQELLAQTGNYILNNPQFEEELKKIPESSSVERTDALTKLLDKIFLNNQKAHLYFLRGKTYADLSSIQYVLFIEEEELAAECEKDSDCPEVDEKCINGVCIYVSTALQNTILQEKKNFLEVEGFEPQEIEGKTEEEINEMIAGVYKKQVLSDVHVIFQPEENNFLGIGEDDLNFYFKDDKWYFFLGDSDSAVEIDSFASFLDKIYLLSSDERSNSALLNEFDGFSNEHKLLIIDLVGKDYRQGIVLLNNYSTQNKEDLSTRLLSSGNELDLVDVSFSSDGIFKVRDVYYKFRGEYWYVSFDRVQWYAATGLPNEEKINDTEVKIIDSLRKKNYEEGAEILFNQNLEVYNTKVMNTFQEKYTTIITPPFISPGEFLLNLFTDSNNLSVKGQKRVCEDCGAGLTDLCTNDECIAIGKATGLKCTYKENIILAGGSCTTQTGFVEPKFSSESLNETIKIVENALLNKIPGQYLVSNCKQYLIDIVDTGNREGIDPILLLALMMQESTCNKAASSEGSISFEKGASYGLMQISGRTWCGQYTLPSDSVECKSKLMSDAKLNIQVGAKILKSYYSSLSKRYNCNAFKSGKQNEPAVDETYSGWSYALRRYNGWACAKILSDGSERFADQDYVEKVLEKYNKIIEYGKK